MVDMHLHAPQPLSEAAGGSSREKIKRSGTTQTAFSDFVFVYSFTYIFNFVPFSWPGAYYCVTGHSSQRKSAATFGGWGGGVGDELQQYEDKTADVH